MQSQSFPKEAAEYWRERLVAVGRAQGRYVFLLALAGLFFAALTTRLFGSSADNSELITLPIIQIEIDAYIVWASGPAVLGVLLMAVYGSMNAFGVADRGLREVLGADTSGWIHESFDSTFNLLDAVFYAKPDTKPWIKRLALFGYPVILTIFYLEAAGLFVLVVAFTLSFTTAQTVFWGTLGFVPLILALPRYTRDIRHRIERFREPVQGQSTAR